MTEQTDANTAKADAWTAAGYDPNADEFNEAPATEGEGNNGGDGTNGGEGGNGQGQGSNAGGGGEGAGEGGQGNN